MSSGPVPYCGTPPTPGAATWNLDPVLIACLLIIAGGHLWLLRREERSRRAMVLAGWTLTSLALISPLCNLSVALFSARVGQHMLISIVAAPLIALGLPRRSIAPRELWTATAAFGVALWFWHSPAPYQATFTSTPIYWAMHISMFTAALWFWWTLLSERRNVWPALFASFLISLQMTLLGALLTFSPKPLFAAHLLTTAPWGFSPLEDQQIGGLIMWVPTGVVLMIYALAGFGRELARLHRPHATVGSR